MISAQGVEKPVLKNKHNENKQEGKMAATISDLSLRDITLESLPRLKRLRELHFNTRPEICL